MNRALRLLPVAPLLVIAFVAVSRGEGEFSPRPFFKSKCSVCHAVPDPAQRTDRAWIASVLKTT